MFCGLVLLAALGAAVAQLKTQCEFVGFLDSSQEHPVAYTARCSPQPEGKMDVCSKLELSPCLANRNGQLQASRDSSTAGFKESCPSCHIDADGWTLSCLCKRMNNQYNYASIDLDTVIYLQNDGIMACSGTVAKQLSECPYTRIGAPPVFSAV
ncbi:hypothetical protein CDD83_10509 [Cordyceps sp. RAO-2017]|nr:hypothetical protein CDD83_10509 [Cordyceps sp. RAO-2017]